MTRSAPEEPGDPASTIPLAALSSEALLAQLRDDQLWLLRQLDAGRWPEWRLDLAALERELDQLLTQLAEGLPGGGPT
jgi:hypothetical protein